jgi:hypothetical protein
MSLWRRTRNEVAGAWRSLRYDLDRRGDAELPGPIGMDVSPAGDPRRETRRDVRDVTSTGMSTFGGVAAAELSTSYPDELPRRPRRLIAVSTFGVLAVMGAAGSYFAVVNGLGSLLSEKPATAEAHPYPLAAGDPAAPSTTGLGETRSGRRAAVALPAPRTTAPAVATPVPARVPPPPARRSRPERTGRPGGADCDCLTPPVPTPTAPSATPSATPSPSPTGSATGGTSASPSPSDTTSDGAFRRKRHARGD